MPREDCWQKTSSLAEERTKSNREYDLVPSIKSSIDQAAGFNDVDISKYLIVYYTQIHIANIIHYYIDGSALDSYVLPRRVIVSKLRELDKKVISA